MERGDVRRSVDTGDEGKDSKHRDSRVRKHHDRIIAATRATTDARRNPSHALILSPVGLTEVDERRPFIGGFKEIDPARIAMDGGDIDVTENVHFDLGFNALVLDRRASKPKRVGGRDRARRDGRYRQMRERLRVRERESSDGGNGDALFAVRGRNSPLTRR